MGTINSTENQALVEPVVIDGEEVFLVDVDGEPVVEDAPLPMAALAVEASLDEGEAIPIISGRIAVALEGVIPEEQAAAVSDAIAEAVGDPFEGMKKADLVEAAEELGVEGAPKMNVDDLKDAITEAGGAASVTPVEEPADDVAAAEAPAEDEEPV
jgi:hypothetical protein